MRYTKVMSKKHKKRNKKYRPSEGAVPETPVIHRFVAEEEQTKDSRKRWKRRSIGYGIISAILLLIAWLVF